MNPPSQSEYSRIFSDAAEVLPDFVGDELAEEAARSVTNPIQFLPLSIVRHLADCFGREGGIRTRDTG